MLPPQEARERLRRLKGNLDDVLAEKEEAEYDLRRERTHLNNRFVKCCKAVSARINGSYQVISSKMLLSQRFLVCLLSRTFPPAKPKVLLTVEKHKKEQSNQFCFGLLNKQKKLKMVM